MPFMAQYNPFATATPQRNISNCMESLFRDSSPDIDTGRNTPQVGLKRMFCSEVTRGC